MKKSAFISLGLVALAAGLVGCNEMDTAQKQDVRSCTDRNGKVVDENLCLQQSQTAEGRNPTDHLLMDMLVYRWVFGGNYNTGSASHYTSVSRGGFGSSFGGGEGEGIGE